MLYPYLMRWFNVLTCILGLKNRHAVLLPGNMRENMLMLWIPLMNNQVISAIFAKKIGTIFLSFSYPAT